MVQVALPLVQNQCGNCTACCKVLGIQELGKPYYVNCEHQGDGCKVYGDHPPSCKDFGCEWHDRTIPTGEEYRPDNFGVMFVPEFEWDDYGIITHYLSVYETRPGGAGVIVTTGDAIEIDIREDVARIVLDYLDRRPHMKGVRYIAYNTRHGLSYQINPLKYPDEKESRRTRVFYVLRHEYPQVIVLLAPQRGTSDKLPFERVNPTYVPRKMSPKEKAYHRKRSKK